MGLRADVESQVESVFLAFARRVLVALSASSPPEPKRWRRSRPQPPKGASVQELCRLIDREVPRRDLVNVVKCLQAAGLSKEWVYFGHMQPRGSEWTRDTARASTEQLLRFIAWILVKGPAALQRYSPKRLGVLERVILSWSDTAAIDGDVDCTDRVRLPQKGSRQDDRSGFGLGHLAPSADLLTNPEGVLATAAQQVSSYCKDSPQARTTDLQLLRPLPSGPSASFALAPALRHGDDVGGGAVWSQYQDKDGNRWWCNQGDPSQWFWAGDPGWECFRDETTGRIWWACKADGRHFFQNAVVLDVALAASDEDAYKDGYSKERGEDGKCDGDSPGEERDEQQLRECSELQDPNADCVSRGELAIVQQGETDVTSEPLTQQIGYDTRDSEGTTCQERDGLMVDDASCICAPQAIPTVTFSFASLEDDRQLARPQRGFGPLATEPQQKAHRPDLHSTTCSRQMAALEIDVLRAIVEEMRVRGLLPRSTVIRSASPHQLSELVTDVVSQARLATLVRRLQSRRFAGMMRDWNNFVKKIGSRRYDPRSIQSVQLLRFICFALARTLDGNLELHGQLHPFEKVVMEVARRKAEPSARSIDNDRKMYLHGDQHSHASSNRGSRACGEWRSVRSLEDASGGDLSGDASSDPIEAPNARDGSGWFSMRGWDAPTGDPHEYTTGACLAGAWLERAGEWGTDNVDAVSGVCRGLWKSKAVPWNDRGSSCSSGGWWQPEATASASGDAWRPNCSIWWCSSGSLTEESRRQRLWRCGEDDADMSTSRFAGSVTRHGVSWGGRGGLSTPRRVELVFAEATAAASRAKCMYDEAAVEWRRAGLLYNEARAAARRLTSRSV